MRLHLGCGTRKYHGFLGVDISPLKGVDVVCDLQKAPWPFKDSCISEFLLIDVIEHLNDTITVMEEIWRIGKPQALVSIIAPYYNSLGAFQDPTHVRFFTEHTFDYFTVENTTPLSLYNFYSHARFTIVKIEPFQMPLLKLLPSRVQWFLAHHLATVHALDVALRVSK